MQTPIEDTQFPDECRKCRRDIARQAEAVQACRLHSQSMILNEPPPHACTARRIEQYAIGALDCRTDIIRGLNNGVIGDDPFHREAGGHQEGLQIGGGFGS